MLQEFPTSFYILFLLKNSLIINQRPGPVILTLLFFHGEGLLFLILAELYYLNILTEK